MTLSSRVSGTKPARTEASVGAEWSRLREQEEECLERLREKHPFLRQGAGEKPGEKEQKNTSPGCASSLGPYDLSPPLRSEKFFSKANLQKVELRSRKRDEHCTCGRPQRAVSPPSQVVWQYTPVLNYNPSYEKPRYSPFPHAAIQAEPE